MTALPVLAALALRLALAAAPAAGADLAARPPEAHGGETRCAACHTAEGWKKVAFAHDRTGFPLAGRHREVTCAACHARSDFSVPVARACAACHRDVHAQRLGQRCERCHEPVSWKQASFDAQAHLRTGFPLVGRHAAIPCEECHGDRRDRSFARPVVQCIGCHQKDFDRTQAAGSNLLDHVAAGFGTDCRSCHGAWRFRPGRFAAHDQCFAINAGPHAGIECRRCHDVSIPTVVAGQPLACVATPPADCLACHGNVDARHASVPGYQRSNPRCYECHRFSTTPLPRSVRGVP
jgi:hypothetical protein